MTDERDIDALEKSRICANCVGEAFLSAQIERDGDTGTCHYCGEDGKTISIGELADEIDAAFENHYRPTATTPSSFEHAMMKEGDYDWEREGEPVVYAIGEAAEIDEEPAEDVRKVLEEKHWDKEVAQMGDEGPFDEEAHYTAKEIDDVEYRENWRYFESNLKTEARFFSATAEATLDSIFEELADHSDPEGNPVIVEAGPETKITSLYRARVFQSGTELEKALKRPDLHVGPPPAALAKAGRMNAHGISVFYGATDANIAIGEVRPPVGSRVIVGQFMLLRKVRLLDVSALRSVYVEGSIFDPAYVGRLERARFLERLSERITRPVMPDDEPLEYLITQVIADYLASRTDPELDGILYPSVQEGTGGANVMLFHKTSRVTLMGISDGTTIDAHSVHQMEDGWETNYWVWEETPPAVPEEPEEDSDSGLNLAAIIAYSAPMAHDYDHREATLQLDLETLKVHHVQAATYAAVPYSVRRHRSEKVEPQFWAGISG